MVYAWFLSFCAHIVYTSGPWCPLHDAVTVHGVLAASCFWITFLCLACLHNISNHLSVEMPLCHHMIIVFIHTKCCGEGALTSAFCFASGPLSRIYWRFSQLFGCRQFCWCWADTSNFKTQEHRPQNSVVLQAGQQHNAAPPWSSVQLLICIHRS